MRKPKCTRTPLTYGTLPDIIGTPRPWPFLYCRTCRGEYSAHRGDYFMCKPDGVPLCQCNRRALILVRRIEILEEV